MSDRKSFFGLDENIASMLTYILGPVTGICALVLERENKTVRFHALQSTIFIGALWLLGIVIGIIPIIRMLTWIVQLATLASIVFLAYNAFKGVMFKVPVVGDVVEQQINK